MVKRNATIDWTLKQSVQAKLRVIVRRILRKCGYPPDKQEKATRTVLEQAELLADVWAAGASARCCSLLRRSVEDLQVDPCRQNEAAALHVAFDFHVDSVLKVTTRATALGDIVTTNTDSSSVSVLCSDDGGALQPAKEISRVRVAGHESDPFSPPHQPVSPGFFETMRIRLIARRDFVASDSEPLEPIAAIVNEAFARRYFGAASAIGRVYERTGRPPPVRQEIVGVVADARLSDPSGLGLTPTKCRLPTRS